MTPSELRTFIEGMEAAGMTTPTPEQWAVIREKLIGLQSPAPSLPNWTPGYRSPSLPHDLDFSKVYCESQLGA